MAVEKPIILHKNVLETGVLTVTSEAAGFPKENLFDGRTFSLWKPTGTGTQDIEIDKGGLVTVDALSIIEHDLGTQTITLEVFEDDNSGFTSPTSLGSKAFTADKPFYLPLTSGNEQFNRIRLTSLDAVPFISQIFLGQQIQMERGPQRGYDLHRQKTFGQTFVSQKGHKLGAAKRFTERQVIGDFRDLTISFVDATLRPFVEDHYLEMKPFFYVPDNGSFPNVVYFLTAPDDPTVNIPQLITERNFVLEASGIKFANA